MVDHDFYLFALRIWKRVFYVIQVSTRLRLYDTWKRHTTRLYDTTEELYFLNFLKESCFFSGLAQKSYLR